MFFLLPTFSVWVGLQQLVAPSAERDVKQENGWLGRWSTRIYFPNKSTRSKRALQYRAQEVRAMLQFQLAISSLQTMSCTRGFARSGV